MYVLCGVDLCACMTFSSMKKSSFTPVEKQSFSSSRHIEDENRPRQALISQMSFSSFGLTATSIALIIVRVYVHAGFIKKVGEIACQINYKTKLLSFRMLHS